MFGTRIRQYVTTINGLHHYSCRTPTDIEEVVALLNAKTQHLVRVPIRDFVLQDMPKQRWVQRNPVAIDDRYRLVRNEFDRDDADLRVHEDKGFEHVEAPRVGCVASTHSLSAGSLDAY